MRDCGSNLNAESSDFANESWQQKLKPQLVSGSRGKVTSGTRHLQALNEAVAADVAEQCVLRVAEVDTSRPSTRCCLFLDVHIFT